VSRFLEASYPRLAFFEPRHLSAALHGLSLFHRPPPVPYLDRVREGELCAGCVCVSYFFGGGVGGRVSGCVRVCVGCVLMGDARGA
jgi:hypothetical protein